MRRKNKAEDKMPYVTAPLKPLLLRVLGVPGVVRVP